MGYHLELGSEGHSFHGKAIVVNSKTGEHKTKAPLPLDLAKAQMKALEGKEAPPAPKAKKETHDDYKGPRNKDGTPKKSTKAWGMYVRDRDRPKPQMMKGKHEGMREDIPEREGEGAKEVKAKAEAKKDALAEFIGSAPEDIAGVDYGAKNKEGKLQQGVITKMLGRENLDVAKSIIVSCQSSNKRQSYAQLCGAIRFIRNIAVGIQGDSSDVKANTFETYSVEVGDGASKAAKDADMCMRILANHENSILAQSASDPKDREKSLRVLMLLPPSRTLRLIEAQMPQGFNSNVGHASGMGHARDNYKWQMDTHSLNLKTKEGREKRDKRLEACAKIAKGLLDSLLASLKQGAYLHLDKAHKATEESKATEKAKAKAAFEIPQGEKNAVEVFLTEDILNSIILAVTGDPKKASAKVEEYRAAGNLGKKAKVYQSNRGNKNVNIKFVKE